MVNSMTGFASRRGAAEGASWLWEIRGVNGKGLDLRLRLPENIDGLEPAVRARLSAALRRGNVTLGLRLVHQRASGALRPDAAALDDAMAALAMVEAAAARAGLVLAPCSAAEVLGLRGMADAGAATDPAADDSAAAGALRAVLLDDLDALVAAFQQMRAEEGAALARLLEDQLGEIADLAARARAQAGARADDMAAALGAALGRVLDNAEGVDEGRLMQELALLAVKADVTEELDRIDTHVETARGLLAGEGPVGRKLDFLMQEFNREANTLCSKAQNGALTRLGLDLKAVIDQMREQVQNVE